MDAAIPEIGQVQSLNTDLLSSRNPKNILFETAKVFRPTGLGGLSEKTDFMMKQSLFAILLVGLGLSTPSYSLARKPVNRFPANYFHSPFYSTSRAVKTDLLTDTSDKTKKPFLPGTPVDEFYLKSFKGPEGIRLNPFAISFVQDYMENYGKDLLQMEDWATPYFNMMDGVLRKYGLPGELKYLAVIESKLKTSAISKAGAVGPWQFMAGTARIMGLRVNHKVDERRNFIKSTHAAARYLNELYGEFGDWLLVIAAYNGGPGNVYAAIRRSGSRNFWVLQRYLPNETRLHVKKYIATHYIFEGQGGITTLTREETAEQLSAVSNFMATRNLSPEELGHAKTMKVSGKYHSQVIARLVLMEPDEFNRYNPNFDKVMAGAESSYELKLPPEKMELFIANKYQILNESVQMLLNEATAAASGQPVKAPPN